MKYRAFVATTLLLCGLGGPATAQVNTLVYCAAEGPDSMNPQLSYRRATFDASARQIYDRLVAFLPGGVEIVPSLARSWKVSPDGLTYSFRLRDGVAFHRLRHFVPTRELNAEDVLFSFRRQLDRKHPYHAVSGGRYPYFEGMGLPGLIAAIDAPTPMTVRFTLKRPYAPFLSVLAMEFASILSAEYAAAMLAAGTPERIDREPVGTGPFQFVHYQRDALIRYVAHDAYWRGKAPLDNLVFTIHPDATVRYQRLRDGECHVMADPDPADIPTMAADTTIRLLRQHRVDLGFLAFNTRRPELADPRVRRALAMAIDRPAIVRQIYQGFGHPANSLLPPLLAATVEEPPGADLEGARALLTEAGAQRLRIEIWPSPVSRPYMPDAYRVAELIRDAWQTLGVQAEIVATGGQDFLKRTMAGEHDAVLFGWIGETLDASVFLDPLLGCETPKSGANRALWCDKVVNGLLRAARETRGAADRLALFELVERRLREEMPLLPLAHSVTVTPLRPEVIGFVPSPLGFHDFYGVDLH